MAKPATWNPLEILNRVVEGSDGEESEPGDIFEAPAKKEKTTNANAQGSEAGPGDTQSAAHRAARKPAEALADAFKGTKPTGDVISEPDSIAASAGKADAKLPEEASVDGSAKAS